MANPFRTVLCSIDFGPNTDLALDAARQIAENAAGKLVLLYVVPLPVEWAGQPLFVEPLSGADQAARQRMETLAAGLNLKVPYEVVAVTGDPPLEISRVAQEHHVDLIVMATHGRTGLSHFFLGSVAERVVRESPVPVLTVRAHQTKRKYPSESVVI
jgi:nucleotide-binding universal stress UspA family protein